MLELGVYLEVAIGASRCHRDIKMSLRGVLAHLLQMDTLVCPPMGSQERPLDSAHAHSLSELSDKS